MASTVGHTHDSTHSTQESKKTLHLPSAFTKETILHVTRITIIQCLFVGNTLKHTKNNNFSFTVYFKPEMEAQRTNKHTHKIHMNKLTPTEFPCAI